MTQNEIMLKVFKKYANCLVSQLTDGNLFELLRHHLQAREAYIANRGESNAKQLQAYLEELDWFCEDLNHFLSVVFCARDYLSFFVDAYKTPDPNFDINKWIEDFREEVLSGWVCVTYNNREEKGAEE